MEAVLKEEISCSLQNDKQKCRDLNSYLHWFWRYLHFFWSACVNEVVAMLNSIQNADLKCLQSAHPRSFGMITLGQYAFWPHIYCELLNQASKFNPCKQIGKNHKPLIPASKKKPHIKCAEPNEEIQIDFRGPIWSEKE